KYLKSNSNMMFNKFLRKSLQIVCEGNKFFHQNCSTFTLTTFRKKFLAQKYLGGKENRYFSNTFSADRRRKSFEDFDRKISLKNLSINQKEKVLQIEWDSERENDHHLFPFVWLRDHCQCNQCFHPVSRSRTMLFDQLQLHVLPTHVEIAENSVLKITWSDGHCSQYTFQWLKERGFTTKANELKRPTTYKLNKVYWGSEILENIPTVKFYDLMTDDCALLTWLQQLEVFGFVLISNAPAEYGQVRQLTERVGFIKKTHYGAEFSVKAKPDPSNVAYSSGPLQLHTDLPYYEYKPGLQLIHCIVQFKGEGGESQIADASHVARELKKNNPDMFKVLSETLVDWCDVGSDEGREFFKVFQNSNGEIKRINYSHPQRDSFFNVDVKTAVKWYEAMKTYQDMLYDSKYCIQFKMTP
ncbi:Gamma-butyrobetaine dioxygenase, partial [Armadillidium nasatum]